MSRQAVLVDPDWVEADKPDPEVAIVEVDEDICAYDRGISRAPSRSTGSRICRTRSAVTSSTRPTSRSCSRSAGSRTTTPSSSTAATTTGSPRTPTGTSSCTGTRSPAARRWPQEVGARLPRAGQRRTGPAQDVLQGPGAGPTIRASGTRWSQPSASNLVDVRSPDEFSGKLLAPAHLPQEQSQRAGHVTSAKNMPWSKAANDDGTFRSTTSCEAVLGGRGRLRQGHDRLLPDR